MVAASVRGPCSHVDRQAINWLEKRSIRRCTAGCDKPASNIEEPSAWGSFAIRVAVYLQPVTVTLTFMFWPVQCCKGKARGRRVW